MATDRVTWLEGHCLSYGGVAAWPFVQALLGWLGAEIGEPEIAVRTKARARPGALLGDEIDGVLPALGRLLRLRIDAPEVPEGAGGIQDVYLRWLEAFARERPVIVALEDATGATEQRASSRRPCWT